MKETKKEGKEERKNIKSGDDRKKKETKKEGKEEGREGGKIEGEKDVCCKPLSEEEISNLAEDIYRGSVFTDRHVHNPEDVPMVFMLLALIEGETLERLRKDPPGMIYEYMDKAGPMAINGMPMFLSLRMANQEDAKKVFERVRKIGEAVKGVK